MKTPDVAGFLEDVRENALNAYLKYRLILLLFLFVVYFAFSGFERYALLKRIAELEYGKEHKDFPVYVDGVKTGLTFKKNQQGHVP